MAQAVIHIKFDPEQLAELADAVAARLRNAPVAQSNPPAPEPQTVWNGQGAPQGPGAPQQASPWGGDQQQQSPWPAQPAPSAQQPAPAQAPAQPSAPTASPAVNQAPFCNHGQMRYVQGGIKRSGPNAGQPYPPFWGCPADRNDPTKCRTVPIQ